MQGCTLSSLTMQVASMSLSVVSTQALLISSNTYSVKLAFFQKAVAVHHDCQPRAQKWGTYAQDYISEQMATKYMSSTFFLGPHVLRE